MHIQIHYVCAECDAPDPKVITLFVRERYCGRHCLSEGQCKYIRMILRAQAEEVEHG